MTPLLTAALLVVFLVHLIAFAVLGVRRRQGYYAALVVTFALLTAATGLQLLAPDLMATRDTEWHAVLRWAAWPAAGVSIAWTLLRVRARYRARRA